MPANKADFYARDYDVARCSAQPAIDRDGPRPISDILTG
jgi:hypothetical protein